MKQPSTKGWLICSSAWPYNKSVQLVCPTSATLASAYRDHGGHAAQNLPWSHIGPGTELGIVRPGSTANSSIGMPYIRDIGV